MPDQTGSHNPAKNPKDQPPLQGAGIAAIEKRVVALESQSHTHKKQGEGDSGLVSAVKRGELALIVINALLLSATIVIAVIYCKQLTAMRESNKISRDALESIQRPFIAILMDDPIRNMQDTGRAFWIFRAHAENSGTSPAIGAVHAMMSDSMPEEPSGETFIAHGFNNEWRLPSATIGAKAPGSFDEIHKPEIPDVFETPPPTDFHRLPIPTMQVNRNLFFWGWVVYRDILPDTDIHLSEFCQRLSNAVYVPSQGRVNIMFSNCQQHNCVDKECRDYQRVVDFATTHTQ